MLENNTFQSVPTVQEITDYKSKTNSEVDVKKFFDYYSKRNWKIGGTPIRNWKSVFDMWTKTQIKTESGKKIITCNESNEFKEYIEWFNENWESILHKFRKEIA